MNNQAKEFLANCNATMTITYLGCEVNQSWGENIDHNTYRATIKTPMGTMWVKFWDSIHNTQNDCIPDEYSILACLQKYDVGSFEDFLGEFGYGDKKIYKAVCREYEKVCRCFTSEQIEQLQEIQ